MFSVRPSVGQDDRVRPGTASLWTWLLVHDDQTAVGDAAEVHAVVVPLDLCRVCAGCERGGDKVEAVRSVGERIAGRPLGDENVRWTRLNHSVDQEPNPHRDSFIREEPLAL